MSNSSATADRSVPRRALTIVIEWQDTVHSTNQKCRKFSGWSNRFDIVASSNHEPYHSSMSDSMLLCKSPTTAFMWKPQHQKVAQKLKNASLTPMVHKLWMPQSFRWFGASHMTTAATAALLTKIGRQKKKRKTFIERVKRHLAPCLMALASVGGTNARSISNPTCDIFCIPRGSMYVHAFD